MPSSRRSASGGRGCELTAPRGCSSGWHAAKHETKTRHGLTSALADPLPSRKTQSADGVPTEAEVDQLHAAYEAALCDVFNACKAAAGYPEAQLVVK